tara:strand:+ start:228 stop:353 length:126 start_codon:yes stop_codon:yes gene_type:complete
VVVKVVQKVQLMKAQLQEVVLVDQVVVELIKDQEVQVILRL